MTTTKMGFTIVELLITITITAIMITLGTSSYRASQMRQALRSDVETSLELLQKAKKMAIVGDQDCAAPSGASLGVKVSFVIDSQDVTLQALCTNNNGTTTTTTLQNSTPTSSVSFTFKPLDGSLTTTGTQSVTLTADDLSTAITVSEAGAITYVQTP